MKRLGSLESNQEAKVALGYATSNSYVSFVLSKLSSCFICRWMHADVYEPKHVCKVAARVQSCNTICKDYSSTLNARFTLLKIVVFFIPLRFRQTFPSSKWRINNTLFGKQWSLERKSPRQSSIPLAKKMNLLYIFKLRTEFSPIPVWP